MEEYHHTSSELLKLSSELRNLGVAEMFSLPTVIFVGDQSSGKSSVLQRLSNVTVPRAQGTCTKVPVEIRMTVADEWKCKISVWDKNVLKTFIELDAYAQNSTDVFIQLAQEATLSRNYEAFRAAADDLKFNFTKSKATWGEFVFRNVSKGSGMLVDQIYKSVSKNGASPSAAAEPLPFSKTPVVVEVQGPNLAHLTVVDLPGIIHSTEKKSDEKFVEMIKEIVVDFLSRDNVLAVAVLNMEYDINNQEAWKLVQKYDPMGEKTVGVLTKIDRCQNMGLLADMLAGDRFFLKNGHYALINPGPDQASIDPLVFQEEEEKRFATEKTFVKYQRRCGIKNLRTYLSESLMAMLRTQIPRIISDADKKLKSVEVSLSGKTPLKDPEREMDMMLQHIHSVLLEEANPRGPVVIVKGEPAFHPLLWKNIKDQTDQLKGRLPQLLPSRLSSKQIEESNELKTNSYNNLASVIKKTVQHIEDSPVPNLPFQPSSHIIKVIIDDSLEKWRDVIDESLKACLDIILKRVLQLVDNYSNKKRFPEFNRTVLDIVQTFFEKKRKEFLKWFDRIVTMTLCRNPDTRNTEYFMQLFEKTQADLMSFFKYENMQWDALSKNAQEFLGEMDRIGVAQLNFGRDLKGYKTFAVSVKSLGTRTFDTVAAVHAYLQINTFRFVDSFLSSLENFYLDASFATELTQTVKEKLGLFGFGNKDIQPFQLRLRPQEEQEIADLQRERETLTQVLAELKKHDILFDDNKDFN